jgi:putative ABC transport system permease protein
MPYLTLLLGAAVLLAITSAVMWWAKIAHAAAPWWAVTRAVGQLALISLALRGVLTHPALVALALAVMVSVAAWTAARRLRDLHGGPLAVVISTVAASAFTIGLAFGLRMLALESRFVIALGGIVIGSTMTATTLAGRNFQRMSVKSRAEIEGWLAIGATPSQSVAHIGRAAAGDAVRPVLDQTRTTGLVTLPGAFVGALMAGAPPLTAGRFQLVVLVCLITAQTIATTLLVHILGRSPVLAV